MSKSTVLPKFRSCIFVSMVAGLFAVTGIPLAVAQDGADDDVEEIVVTGSYIKRSQSDMPSPIQILDSEELRDIGASSLPELVNSLTINTGAQIYQNHLDQGRNAGTTNINLRGLGEASTLVLLNGTRNTLTPAVTGDGDQYVNLSALVPMIAVERVEILKDGASSLYGSDAVAGVVNFITRDKFEGLEFKIEASNNEYGADEFNIGLIVGGRHERGNFMAAFEYMTVDPVTNAERSADYAGTRNSITGLGMPSSIANFGLPGPPLVLPDPMCDAVGSQLNPPDADLVFLAFICRLQYGYYGHVVGDEERMQGYVSGTFEFSDRAEFFGEMTFSNNELIIGSVPTQPVTNPVYVPENHPDLPLFAASGGCCGVDPVNDIYLRVTRVNPLTGIKEEQWFGRMLGAGSPQNNDLKPFESWRAKGGLRGALNDTWDYTLSYAYSIEETNAFRVESKRNELQQALYGQGGPGQNETFYIAWENRGLNSPELYDHILGIYGYDAKSTQKVFDAIVSGELFEMAGGTVGAAIGVQYREDTLAYDYNDDSEEFIFTFFIGGDDFMVDQKTTAVFGELAFPFSEDLEMNVSARWEDLETDTTVDPKVSFLFTPTDQWSLRASWGTSFRVASLFAQGGSTFDAGSGTDPFTGQGVTFRAEDASDPSTPLVPQEATTFNVGASFRNDAGLTASIDYWNFDYDGFIAVESHASVLALDGYPANPSPQVDRGPPPGGNVISVVGFVRNAGFLKTDGIDLSLSYAIDTDAGTFTPFLDSTYMLSYELDDPSWGRLDALGWANRNNIGAPAIELRANIGVHWAKEDHGANIYVRYIDSYVSDESSARLGGPITDGMGNLDVANFIPVDSLTQIDAQYSYHFDGMFGSDTDSTIRLGVRNATDERAPPFYSTSGYDEEVHDPRGRYVYLSLRTTFN